MLKYNKIILIFEWFCVIMIKFCRQILRTTCSDTCSSEGKTVDNTDMQEQILKYIENGKINTLNGWTLPISQI